MRNCAYKDVSKHKMKRIIAILILIFLNFYCIANNGHNNKDKKTIPPGTVQVDTNLFMDYAEITNFSYLEYLYWTERVFGKNSNKYIEAYPDTSVWVKQDTSLKDYSTYYLNHVAYRYYPVVGISHSQAINYSKWRSDRVFELHLIKQKIIEHQIPDSTNYFSIENYFTGNYYNIVPEYSIKYPSYNLPTKEEWLNGINHGKKINTTNAKKCKSKYCDKLFSNKELTINSAENVTIFESKIIDPTIPTSCSSCKKEILYNLNGNVRELSNTPKISFGGGWTDNLDTINNQIEFNFVGPNAYTGFRNVCSWKYYNKPTR